MTEAAPLFDEISGGPDGGVAYWLRSDDGVRIRVGHWPLDGAKGTVLIFPGRTEFVEKYGHLAKDLQAAGYASLAIDWRGQGIADRLIEPRSIGHVGDFEDYQRDVAAVVTFVVKNKLPGPYYLLAHSMGGCIGLRALHNGLGVKAVMFSAPMWGVAMTPPMRLAGKILSTLSIHLNFSHKLTPGQTTASYVLREIFSENTLTNDPQMWEFFRRQLQTKPDLGLGGPSLGWVYHSLKEMQALSEMPSPDLPCLTYLGTGEAIVDPQPIHDRMAAWPNSTLRVIEGGLHEMLMDKPAMRDAIIAETVAHFNAHRG